MSQDRKQSSYPPSHCYVSHQCLPFVSFFLHVACYSTSTSTLATSDQFNWPEIMRLLIYYQPLIEWKPFTVTILESFIRPSLSLSIPFSISFSLSSCLYPPFTIQTRKIYGVRISSPLCDFIGSSRHFYTALSFVSILQHAPRQYRHVANSM